MLIIKTLYFLEAKDRSLAFLLLTKFIERDRYISKLLRQMGSPAVWAALKVLKSNMNYRQVKHSWKFLQTMPIVKHREIAIPVLTNALKNATEIREIKEIAVKKLSEIANPNPALLPLLEQALKSYYLRANAIIALGKMGEKAITTLPVLISLPKMELLEKKIAAKSISQMGPKVIPALVKYLNHKNKNVRILAIKSLEMMYRKTLPVVKDLQQSLKYQDMYMRVCIAKVLWKLKGYNIFPIIASALKSNNVAVELNAVETLASMGQKAHPMVGNLKKLLHHKDYRVKVVAAVAIAKINNTVKHLISFIRNDRDYYVRSQAAIELAKLETMAIAAIPKLIDVVKPSFLMQTMAKIKPQHTFAISVLVNLSKHEDDRIRIKAIKSLARFGPKTASKIIVALKDTTTSVRLQAAIELGKLKVSSALVALSNVIKKDHSWEVRVAAQKALNKIK